MKKPIKKLILEAAKKSKVGKYNKEDPGHKHKLKWPIDCNIGPGLEGAIACETKIGYINGSRGQMIYRGYDIFDLCANSTYEEVSYLLLNGNMPTEKQLIKYKKKLVKYRKIPNTLRNLLSFPIEEMHPMAALRLGTNLMRHRLTWRDSDSARPAFNKAIAADEDSIPMEIQPYGEKHAKYEFKKQRVGRPAGENKIKDDAASRDTCTRLVSGVATLTAAIARIRENKLPIEPDPELSHSANFIYMMTGKRPTKEEEKVMDICLILHADHGMNASTFASLVVASTLSDIYLSIGAGIAALSGPLHGGANEAVIKMLEKIGKPGNVETWFKKARSKKELIPGFGHRVYKAYDPRALILAPLAKQLTADVDGGDSIFKTANKLEDLVVSTLGKEKGIYPNVDFYSGLVYRSMGIPDAMFTPIFAVSRVAGWTARINEYLQTNRIFRPRAAYTGDFGNKYVPIKKR
jgi:citrate synthase